MNIQAIISAVDQLSGVLGRIMGAIGQVAHAVSSILGRAFDLLSGIISRVFGLVQGLAEKMLHVFTMGGGIGGAMSIAGLTMLGKKALDTAAMFEILRAQMETAYGSKAKGGEMFDWAVEFAAKTPFDVPQIVEATTLLKLFGLEAKKWLPLVGDMAGAMGKDVTQATQAVANALMGEGEMLKQFGINSQMLVKYGAKQSKSGIGVDSTDRAGIEGALESIITERFGGGMARMFQTVQGVLSNIGDAVKTAFNKIGEPISAVVKWIGEDVMRIVTALGDKLAPVVQALAPLFAQTAANLLNFVVQGVNRLPRLAELFERLVAVVLPMQQALGGKLADLLGKGLDWLLDKFEQLIKNMEKLGGQNLLNNIADAVGGALVKIGDALQVFGEWVQTKLPTILLFAITFLQTLGSVAITVAKAISEAVGYAFAGMEIAIGETVKRIGEVIQGLPGLGGFGKQLAGAGETIGAGGDLAAKGVATTSGWADAMQKALNDAVAPAVGAVMSASNTVGNMAIGAGQAVSGAGQGLQNWNPQIGGMPVPESTSGRGGRPLQVGPIAITVQQGDGVKADVQKTANVQASMKNLKLG